MPPSADSPAAASLEPPPPPNISSAPAASSGHFDPKAPVPTPHPATGATQAAIELYPDLGKKNTAFNRAFRELFEDKKVKDPVFLASPDWPLQLADETANMLHITSRAPKLAEGTFFAPNPAPAPAPVKTTPEWMQKKLEGSGSSLDHGAYNQNYSVYHHYPYYYYGPYRYWIDPNGVRHYEP